MRKQILIAVALALFCSCARYWVKEDMQPDHSYKVVADGNGLASLNGARERAYDHAAHLCPNGFVKQAEVPDDSFKPTFTLVVTCK